MAPAAQVKLCSVVVPPPGVVLPGVDEPGVDEPGVLPEELPWLLLPPAGVPSIIAVQLTAPSRSQP